MENIVAKFGGSSLADAGQFEKVRRIVAADPRRRFVVPSAPGRRFPGDDKVTDLLYRCHRLQSDGREFMPLFQQIGERYRGIAQGLGVQLDFGPHLEEIAWEIGRGASADYCASRGEYLSGLLLAQYLGYPFVDAKDVIFFNEQRRFDAEKTQQVLSATLSQLQSAVIPGFYGSLPNGQIHTFSRGGSDTTGALVARAVGACLYENWTDVSGFLKADPHVVPHAGLVSHITYRQLYELSSAGATVLHQDSVEPVSRANIPINIRNTNHPEHPGTLITAQDQAAGNGLVGIAGKGGYSLVLVECAAAETDRLALHLLQALEQVDFAAQILSAQGGKLGILISADSMRSSRDAVLDEIRRQAPGATLAVYDNMGMITLVGRGSSEETFALLGETLLGHGITPRIINRTDSQISTWVAVEEQYLQDAIRALYSAFAL